MITVRPGGPRRNPIYAIVRSGGRQYRVEPDQLVDVDLLEAEVGSTVDLNVLLLAGNGESHVGTPLVDGAKVVAEVVGHVRAGKIRIFKYKNKTRRRQRMGHRQDLTRLHVTQIVTATGDVIKVERKKPATDAATAEAPRRRKRAAEPEPEPEAAAEATVEAAPEAEAKLRRARRTHAEPEPEAAAEASGAEAEAEAPKPRARRPRAPKPAAEEPESEAPANEDEE